jgi:hypothetical protein
MEDLEVSTTKSLFPIARHAHTSCVGILIMLALDASGRVDVIQVKRDVDHNRLAQCLEYES